VVLPGFAGYSKGKQSFILLVCVIAPVIENIIMS